MESVHPRVALSLGEAELYASVRGATETVRFMSTMREFRDSSQGQITHRVLAGVCRAIILRHGCGGLKHITGRTFFCGEYHEFLAPRIFSTSFIAMSNEFTFGDNTLEFPISRCFTNLADRDVTPLRH